jgi:hypothetical protein
MCGRVMSASDPQQAMDAQFEETVIGRPAKGLRRMAAESYGTQRRRLKARSGSLLESEAMQAKIMTLVLSSSQLTSKRG